MGMAGFGRRQAQGHQDCQCREPSAPWPDAPSHHGCLVSSGPPAHKHRTPVRGLPPGEEGGGGTAGVLTCNMCTVTAASWDWASLPFLCSPVQPVPNEIASIRVHVWLGDPVLV